MLEVREFQGPPRPPVLPSRPEPTSAFTTMWAAVLVLLAGGCVAGVCWQISGCLRAEEPGKPLRAEAQISKLKEGDGPPPLPAPPPLEPIAPLPPLPPIAPSLPEPPPELTVRMPAAPALPEELPIAPVRNEVAPPVAVTVAEPSLPEPPPLPLETAPPPVSLPPTVTESPKFVAPPPVPVVDQGVEKPPVVLLKFPSHSEWCLEPLVYPRSCALQSGESPMIRNWKTLALYALIAPTPVWAQPPAAEATDDLAKLTRRVAALEENGKETLTRLEQLKRLDLLDGIQKDLRQVSERLQSLEDRKPTPAPDLDGITKNFRNLSDRVVALEDKKPAEAPAPVANGNNDAILAALNELRKEVRSFKEGVNDDLVKVQLETTKQKGRIDALETNLSSLAEELRAARKKFESGGTVANSSSPVFEDIRAKLTAIEQAILKLVPTTNRASYFQPAPTNTSATTGRVLLVNEYNEDLLFIVNNKVMRVPALRSEPLDAVPAGTLNYKVVSPTWGVRADKTSNLASNQTLTITAR